MTSMTSHVMTLRRLAYMWLCMAYETTHVAVAWLKICEH